VARRIAAYGLIVAIDADEPDLFRLLDQHLPAFPAAATTACPSLAYRVSTDGEQRVVIRDHETVVVARDLDTASRYLVQDLQSMIATRVPGLTLVHAGVVAYGRRALILPGRSGAGKTTLVAALVAAGAEYGSDEFAVVDREGRVHAYARPLAFRSATSGDARIAPGALGARVLSGPLPVGAILFTTFVPGAVVALRPLPVSEVALGLLRHAPGARDNPTKTIGILGAVAARARGLTGPRGEAKDAVAAVVNLLRAT
jgi:hypothetical protein